MADVAGARNPRQKPTLHSLPQAAARLGMSTACLRSWVYRRSIPYVKVGRAVRIADETIDKIIERGSIPALEQR